jgi:hypothetical protein
MAMKMTHYFRIFILASALLVGMVWLIAGCGGSDTEPTGPGGGNEAPVSTHLIGSEDRQRMSDAAMSYVMMLQTMEPAAARAALVADLEETEGVAAASLFEDGYSIFVRLESGLDVALNTLDLAAVNEGAQAASAGPSDEIPEGVFENAPDKGGFSPDAHAPTSRKVLILVVNGPEMPFAAGAAAFIGNQFQLAGWDASDIKIKTRTTSTSTAITPDDLLDLDEYGVVVLFAHSLYGSPDGGDASLYVQACSAVDYGAVASPERSRRWNELIDSGVLITGGTSASGDECFYLREDFFAADSDSLPETLFQLVTPFGSQLITPLDLMGAGSIMGWDNVFRAGDAYASVRYFFQAMTSGAGPSDGEVYGHVGLEKESVNPEDGSPAALETFGEGSQLYLPAWAHVHFEGLPAGTALAGIGINYLVLMDGGIPQPRLILDSGADGDIDQLVPVRVEVLGSAVDEDEITLAAVHFETEVVPGENSLTVDFSRQHIQAVPLRMDFEMANGRLSTAFLNYYLFDENPFSNQYLLFNDFWVEGLEIYQPLINEGENLYIRSDRCFDHEQVQYIWGHDPIDVPAGQVVYLGGGSCQYGNYLPDDLTWDEETQQMITYREEVNSAWAQFQIDNADAWIEIVFQ